MLSQLFKNNLIAAVLLTLILSFTFLAFFPGLSSPFVFDDIPNLIGIGSHENLGTWRDFALYLLEGKSGILGRPISLASFYLNDQTWQGMSPEDFKYTNVMLHLLNGVLLFWLSQRLLAYLPTQLSWIQSLPFLVAAAWLLHPMHTNTVLYAVQRMTELSALFTLIGILCYLHGREIFSNRPKMGLFLLFGGVGICGLLGLLSKENGILLSVYILALEYTLLKNTKPPANQSPSRIIILIGWLPLILLCIMLIKWGWFDKTGRAFNTVERLLTESRIIWEYISNIFLPSYRGSSLFHEDFIISKNILNPLNTLPAVLGILTAFGFAVYYRKKYPVIAFGILWFLGGHLLESTTIALELYFEHRNYLPMFGLLFAAIYYLIVYISKERKTIKAYLAISFVILSISLLGLITHKIAKQWSDPATLLLGWLEQHPSSPRTLEALDAVIGNHISKEARQNILDELYRTARNSTGDAYLMMKDTAQACIEGQLTPAKLDVTLSKLKTNRFSLPLPGLVGDFLHNWTQTACQKQLSTTQILSFIEHLRAMPHLQQGEMPYILHQWQAEVHVQEGSLEKVMQHLDAAYILKKNVDLLLLQATYLGSAGLYTEAEERINNAHNDFCDSWRTCLILKMRQPDLDNLRSALQDKLQQKKANHHAQQAVDYSASQK